MEKVKVSIKGAGSLEVEGAEAKDVLDWIGAELESRELVIRRVKRGPKKRLVIADEGAEGNNHD